MAEKRYRRSDGLVEGILLLATAPALAVGVAAYSFNFDAIRLVVWLFGGNRQWLWGHFWYYVLLVVMAWALFGVRVFWRER